MSEISKLTGTTGLPGKVRLYSANFEANGAGTCELREGSPTGTLIATLRLAGAGQVAWQAGDPVGVSIADGLYVVCSLGSVTISCAHSPVLFDSIADAPTLQAWYDFSDITTLWQNIGATVQITTDGQDIDAMSDKSGGGHLMITQFEGDGPTYVAEGLSGLSVGRDGLLFNHTALTVNQAKTIVVLTRQYVASDATTRPLLHMGSSWPASYLGTDTDLLANGHYFWYSGVYTDLGAVGPWTTFVLRFTWNGSLEIWRDGGPARAIVDPDNTYYGGSLDILGTDDAGIHGAGHEVAEHIQFDGALSLAEINAVVDEVSRKWRTPWANAV